MKPRSWFKEKRERLEEEIRYRKKVLKETEERLYHLREECPHPETTSTIGERVVSYQCVDCGGMKAVVKLPDISEQWTRREDSVAVTICGITHGGVSSPFDGQVDFLVDRGFAALPLHHFLLQFDPPKEVPGA